MLQNNEIHTGGQSPPNQGHPAPKSRRMRGDLHLVGVDNRTKPARRWRGLFSTYLNANKPPGGPNDHHRNAAKRAASLTLLVEKMESDLVAGRQVDAAVYTRTLNTLNRYLASLGLEPRWEEDKDPQSTKPNLEKLRDPNTWKGQSQ